MKKTTVPVILSGGDGTRLWPISRQNYPKQFLKINSDLSLLQQTISRLAGISCEKPIIVCNENHRFLVKNQIDEIGVDATIILETERKDTAAAIALAAFKIKEQYSTKDPKQIQLLVMSSDHYMKDTTQFADLINNIMNQQFGSLLMAIGVKPSSPHTGYGYLQKGEEILPNFVYKIEKFHEKPDTITAEKYVSDNNYFWNSGIFLFELNLFLTELNVFNPAIYSACEAAIQAQQTDLGFIKIDANEFSRSDSISIDYAIMERTKHAAMVVLNTEWSDIGAWDVLSNIYQEDQCGNVNIGYVQSRETKNCLIYSSGRLVATQGVDNLVIIETPDAIFVQDKKYAQDTKKMVANLIEHDVKEAVENNVVNRPWGTYCSIAAGERFQVKKITVRPKQRLSIQLHHHRSEHWIVVKGTARVMVGDEVKLLTENQSTYIPVGVKHYLENPGEIPLELIEVQSGAYLGEDDIVRFEDIYGRI